MVDDFFGLQLNNWVGFFFVKAETHLSKILDPPLIIKSHFCSYVTTALW